MISIVIPVHNERENIGRVLAEARKAHPAAEIIVVDDGSADGTAAAAQAADAAARVISLPSHQGKGFALHAGFLASTRDTIVTMDGDGQSDPKDVWAVVRALEESQADCACGYRTRRAATIGKLLGSRIGNAARRVLLRSARVRDAGCPIRALKKAHVPHLFPFEGLHRYLPDMLSLKGLIIIEIPVSERPRISGKSKYSNLGRAIRGLGHIAMLRKRTNSQQTHAS